MLAICGPSGAGKTTLLTIVAGLLRPQSRPRRHRRQCVSRHRHGVDLPARRRRIGYVFQEARLFPHLSVAQNLRYGQRFTPAGRRFVDFDAVTALLGPGAAAGAPAGQSFRRREAARRDRPRSAGQPAACCMMDEPLAALDDARRLEILAYIEKMRDAFAIPDHFRQPPRQRGRTAGERHRGAGTGAAGRDARSGRG